MITWLGDIVTSGDVGRSTLTNRLIGPELLQRLQNTLHVGVATIVVGLLLARVFAGAVIVEQIFNIPGIGRWLVQAALQAAPQRELLIVQAMILAMALAIGLANGPIEFSRPMK